MPMSRRISKVNESYRFGQRQEIKRNLLVAKPTEAWMIKEKKIDNEYRAYLST